MVLFALCVCLGLSAPAGLPWLVLARPICLYPLFVGDVPSCVGLPSRRWWCWCLRGPGPRSALACTGRGPATAGQLQLAAGPAPWLWAAGARRGHGARGRGPGPGLGAGLWCRGVYSRPRPTGHKALVGAVPVLVLSITLLSRVVVQSTLINPNCRGWSHSWTRWLGCGLQ